RRRHTIFSRDWSSDVCSSYLNAYHPAGPQNRSTLHSTLSTMAQAADGRSSKSPPFLNRKRRDDQRFINQDQACFKNTRDWVGREIGRASCRERGKNCGF